MAALEDRVKTEEAQWSPLLQLHYPDKLDDYLNMILVETGQRFFKKELMDAPGCSDLAAKRRELLSHRLEARKNIGGPSSRAGWTWATGRYLSKRSELRRNSWTALRLFSRRSGCECVVGDMVFMKKSAVWPGREASLEQAVGWPTMGRKEEGLQGVDGSVAFHEGLAG